MDGSQAMNFRFTKHSLEKAFQRNIPPFECEQAFNRGEITESYPLDNPYPSELRLAKINGRFLHIVTSSDGPNIHVITVYEPDLERWESDFKTRRRQTS